MATITVTAKAKRLPFLPREVIFMGSDEAIAMVLRKLKFWGPLDRDIKSALNFDELDAILQQIQAEHR